MKWLVTLLAVTALTTAPVTWAGAGSSQDGHAHAVPTTQVYQFAQKVEQTLAAHGARVAILSRVGRPPKELPAGIQYTHVAFAVYSAIELDNGDTKTGYVVYNLYQNADEPNVSSLVKDFPHQFFTGVPLLRAGIIIPVAEVQQKLLNTIVSDRYDRLHNESYSVIANPFNDELQNCTEFTLNVINAAIYNTDDLSQIKRALNDHFEAQPVNMNPLKLMAGAAILSELSLKDHGDTASTATFGSIERYMEKYGLIYKSLELSEWDIEPDLPHQSM